MGTTGKASKPSIPIAWTIIEDSFSINDATQHSFEQVRKALEAIFSTPNQTIDKAWEELYDYFPYVWSQDEQVVITNDVDLHNIVGIRVSMQKNKQGTLDVELESKHFDADDLSQEELEAMGIYSYKG